MIHWDYYISLENDLLSCRRYVEFHHANMQVYSIEFVRLLLATCSEVDVLAKSLCKRIAEETEADNIRKYRKMLEPSLALSSFQVFDVVTNSYRIPFVEWGKQDSTEWWRSYNHVKHDRFNKYKEAALAANLAALAGLYILNLYWYWKIVQEEGLIPESQIFKPQIKAHRRVHSGVACYRLPNSKQLVHDGV